jgi:hypothetical protein
MSAIKFPKWAIKAINTQMANVFWNGQKNCHKYHLSNCPSVARRKEQGGLGISDLRDLNLCLLASWVQRYHEVDDKLWREIIDHKYDVSPNIFYCNPRNTPSFGKGWFGQLRLLNWVIDGV